MYLYCSVPTCKAKPICEGKLRDGQHGTAGLDQAQDNRDHEERVPQLAGRHSGTEYTF